MKKIIALIMLICVSAALFASVGITVRAGGAFGFANLKTVATGIVGKVLEKENQHILNGFGFDAGVQYDISDKIMVFADFNMLFPKDGLYISGTGKKWTMSEMAELNGYNGRYDSTYKIDFYSISAGAAYRLDLGIPVKIALGAGVSFHHLKNTLSAVDHQNTKGDIHYYNISTVDNLGVCVMVGAKYMVTENIGLGLTVIPQVGLYNFSKIESLVEDDVVENKSGSSNGFKVNFAMPVTIGASYSF